MKRQNLLGQASSEIDSMDIYNEDDLDENYEYQSDQTSSQYISSSQIEEEDISKQSLNLQLLKENLKNFGTMRGMHSFVNIASLPRLSQSSYVEYNDKQSYKSNQDLNRIYKGCPLNDTDSFSSEIETKTEFHEILFDIEDQRHNIDVEILQLKYLAKKIKKFRLHSYDGYKRIEKEQPLNFDQVIQKQISQLKEKRELINNVESEKMLFNLSIDQVYYNNLLNSLQEFTSHWIKSFYSTKQNLIVTNVSLAFHIQDLVEQPTWLNQYEQTYIELHHIHHLLLPPIQILNFQNQQALHISCMLLSSAFQNLPSNQHNIWMTYLFKDFLNAVFKIDDALLSELNSQLQACKHQNWEATANQEQFISKQQPPPIPVNNQLKINTHHDSSYLDFFPNFQGCEIMYSQLIFLELFHLLHELYTRLYKIITCINFKESLILQMISVINGEIRNFQFISLLKQTFCSDISIYIQSILTIVQYWKKSFLTLDENSKELLMQFTQKKLVNKSKIKIQDAKLSLFITPENILRKMSYESRSQRLCRIQNINNVIFIHLFVLQNLQV